VNGVGTALGKQVAPGNKQGKIQDLVR
jgi:hypothetical protein